MERNELEEVKKRYASWSSEELIQATTVEKNDYSSEAITLMLKELERRSVSPEETSNIQTEIKRKKQDETNKYSGIRGILLVFLIAFLGSSLVSFVDGLTILLNYTNEIARIFSIALIAIGIYGIFTFVLLVLKRKSAPGHAWRQILLTFLVHLASNIRVFLYTKELTIDMFFWISVATLFWLTYLQNSERVAITYGVSNETESVGIEKDMVFSCPKCNKEIQRGQGFCSYCNTEIDWSDYEKGHAN